MTEVLSNAACGFIYIAIGALALLCGAFILGLFTRVICRSYYHEKRLHTIAMLNLAVKSGDNNDKE